MNPINNIKLAYPLDMKELNPFFDLRQLSHVLLLAKGSSSFTDRDAQSALNECYRKTVKEVFDFSSNATWTISEPGVLSIIMGLRLSEEDGVTFVSFGHHIEGRCDIIQKLARGVVIENQDVKISEATKLKLMCIYDNYYGESCSVAVKKDTAVAVEFKDAGTGIMGKTDYFVTILDAEGKVYRDRLSKYGITL